jgi:DNA-binding MarR family transcriptional regulator
MPWTWSQINTLARIAGEGPTTVSALAAAEHVRPQSMAATVAALLHEGLLAGAPDPTDGRKTLLSVTAEGRELVSHIPALRETWLEGAVGRLSAAERRTLAEASRLMERLADS